MDACLQLDVVEMDGLMLLTNLCSPGRHNACLELDGKQLCVCISVMQNDARCDAKCNVAVQLQAVCLQVPSLQNSLCKALLGRRRKYKSSLICLGMLR